MLKINTYVVLLFLIALLLMSSAQGSLLITPTRVAFSERERSKDIVLINRGTKEVTYRLEWVEQIAKPKGGYRVLTPAELQGFPVASSMLRFTPRQVTLQPGERQIVRLATRKPSNLAEGEYRSFLKFSALPPKLADDNSGAATGIRLDLILSYALPIIVRHGETNVDLTAKSVELAYDRVKNKGKVKVMMARTGSASAHLNILAYWTPSSGGPERLIARNNAFNAYPELEQISVNLSWLGESLDDTSGILRVVLEGAGEYSNQVFDNTKFIIAPGKIQPLAL